MKEARAASEPEALIAALREIDVPLERIGLEACSLTAWLHDELCAARPAGDLHRDAAGQRGDEDDAEQDRSQRRPRAWRRSCARAGIGRSMSRAASAGCGVRSWSPAARS